MSIHVKSEMGSYLAIGNRFKAEKNQAVPYCIPGINLAHIICQSNYGYWQTHNVVKS